MTCERADGALVGRSSAAREVGPRQQSNRAPLPRWLSAAASALALAVAACGGGTASDPAVSGPSVAADSAELPRGALLNSDWAAYPRLVRLAHQSDSTKNGRILASVTERLNDRWQAGLHSSEDGGASFRRLAAVTDDRFQTGLCCGSLFELPQDVGTLPAGTLLYAASVGADTEGALMEQPIYRSDDAGASFRRVEGASCGRSPNPRGGSAGWGVWEPEFFIAGDGSLACVHSDETEPGRSQVLKLTTTRDGVAWSAPRVIVTGPLATDRPGMATVRRLPNGRFAMSFENCSSVALDCAARLRWSDDGLDWGDPATLGTRPQTAGGAFFRHTPTLVWLAETGHAHGALALIGQIVAGPSGAVDPVDNGQVLFINANGDGSGDWRMVAAPIGLAQPPSTTNWCQNYSSALLPSADGLSLLMMQTDRSDAGACLARFGTGTLAWSAPASR
jgi:hypothetical protein